MVIQNYGDAFALSSVSMLAAFYLGACNAESLPDCPQTLVVAQTAKAIPEGWEGVPYAGTQRLARITFKLRSDPGELRPDEDSVGGGKRILIRAVDGMKDIEQICVYTGTLARLSRPVPSAVTRCEVHEEKVSGGPPRLTANCH